MKNVVLVMVGFIIINLGYNNFLYAETWQETLESNFDIVDTFDHYQDWTGLTATNSMNWVTDPDDLPLYIDGSYSTMWKKYAYNPDGEVGGEGRLGPWIGNHGASHQVGSKGLKLMTRGFGPASLYMYLGDGSANSGYSEMFMFWRLNMPHNAFPTNTDPNGGGVSHSAVEYIQSVFDSTGYLYRTGWKYVNFGTGFTGVDDHSSGCFYGDGEAWLSIYQNRNDTGAHMLFGASTCGFVGCNNGEECWTSTSIGFDQLGAMEIRLKLETYSPDGVVQQYGEIEIWWYDSDGNPIELMPTRTQVTFMQPEDSGHLLNRIFINGNKHRYDTTGLPTSPPGYNYSVGEYTLGDGMAEFYFIDDVVVDDQRIGPKYFSLLGSGIIDNPPGPPAIPTGLTPCLPPQ